jgi:hypothetical protein
MFRSQSPPDDQFVRKCCSLRLDRERIWQRICVYGQLLLLPVVLTLLWMLIPMQAFTEESSPHPANQLSWWAPRGDINPVMFLLYHGIFYYTAAAVWMIFYEFAVPGCPLLLRLAAIIVFTMLNALLLFVVRSNSWFDEEAVYALPLASELLCTSACYAIHARQRASRSAKTSIEYGNAVPSSGGDVSSAHFARSIIHAMRLSGGEQQGPPLPRRTELSTDPWHNWKVAFLFRVLFYAMWLYLVVFEQVFAQLATVTISAVVSGTRAAEMLLAAEPRVVCSR